MIERNRTDMQGAINDLDGLVSSLDGILDSDHVDVLRKVLDEWGHLDGDIEDLIAKVATLETKLAHEESEHEQYTEHAKSEITRLKEDVNTHVAELNRYDDKSNGGVRLVSKA